MLLNMLVEPQYLVQLLKLHAPSPPPSHVPSSPHTKSQPAKSCNVFIVGFQRTKRTGLESPASSM